MACCRLVIFETIVSLFIPGHGIWNSSVGLCVWRVRSAIAGCMVQSEVSSIRNSVFGIRSPYEQFMRLAACF